MKRYIKHSRQCFTALPTPRSSSKILRCALYVFNSLPGVWKWSQSTALSVRCNTWKIESLFNQPTRFAEKDLVGIIESHHLKVSLFWIVALENKVIQRSSQSNILPNYNIRSRKKYLSLLQAYSHSIRCPSYANYPICSRYKTPTTWT